MTDHPPPPPPSSPPSGPSHPSSSTHLPVPPPTPPHSRPDRASPTDTMLAILSPPTTETMTTAPGQGPGPVLEPQDLTLPPTTTTTPRLAQSQAQASQQTPTTSAAFDYLTQPQRLSRDNCDRRRPPEDESAPRDRGLINMPPDLVGKTLSPFLKEHIPDLYAPIGKNNHKKTASASSTAVSVPSDSHSKYCYRHRPDSKCRRAADEKKMGIIQRDLDSLSTADQQAITHVWSTFSAAPSKQRELILQGIITQCCFPQLSAVSREVAEQLKIDFLATLPVELSYKILCYLDTVSLCKAAQVSRRWRALADDDVVWHRMCEQHIDRCCSKCGWGLPLLEKRRLKAWSRHQLTAHAADDAAAAAAAARAPVEEPSETPATPGSNKRVMGPARCDDATGGPSTAAMTTMTTMTTTATTTTTTAAAATAAATTATTTSLAVPSKRPRVQGSCRKSRAQLDEERKFRPWKDVYRDRYKIGWNWKTGRCSVRTFKGHSNGVTCLQMDNNILATGSYDTTIKIWNSETGAVIRTLRGHSQSIRSLQFDDSKLISASFDKTIKIWNWQTGECLSTLQCHSDGVLSVHFEGLTLASGSIDRTVKIFSFDTKQTFTLRGHTDWVNHVRVDAASRTVFSASDDLSVKLWDLDSKRCVRTYLGHVGQVQQILLMPADFEPDVDPAADRRGDRAADRTDAASTHSSTDPRGKTPSPEPPEPTSSSSTTTTTTATTTTSSSSSSGNGVHDRAAFGPGFLSDPSRPLPPRYMLTGGLDNTVRLWDVATGRCVRSMFGHVEGVWALAGDTIRVVTGANDSMVKIWEPRSGKCERSFTGHAGPVTCVGLGDSRMASGSEDGEVRLYSFDGDGDMAERGTPS